VNEPEKKRRERLGFGEDFRRFFVRGAATLLPTLITLWLLVKIWQFLWEALGQHIIYVIGLIWHAMGDEPYGFIGRYWVSHPVLTNVIGVLLAILLVYIVGVFVGNLLGRTLWRLAETGVMRIPLVRAIYPAVKQVTDFLLSDRSGQFSASRVVAVQPHEGGIWSLGLLTGTAIDRLSKLAGDEMVTVFIPSTPTAFTGYVVVVPRQQIVELPLSVEEAMRVLISGGVLTPTSPARMQLRADEEPAKPPALAGGEAHALKGTA
jgi:uncharacterized membrane protein